MFDVSTVDKRKDFIFRRWDNLAAFGYAAYLSLGRGVIILQLDGGRVVYNTAAGLSWMKDETFRTMVQEGIETYDPTDEIICIVMFNGMVTQGYYGSDDLSPEQAYNQARARLESSANRLLTADDVAARLKPLLDASMRPA
jgi:hypothetical protein